MTRSVQLIEIPYRPDSAHYVERVLDLPHCIYFDSGFPESTLGRYDVLSAAPCDLLEVTQGELRHSPVGKRVPARDLINYLNGVLGKKQLPGSALPSIKLPFFGGFAGYFSYDLARCWEQLPAIAKTDIDLPDMLLGYYTWSAVLDHAEHKAWLSFLPDCPESLRQDVHNRLVGGYPEFKLNKCNINNRLKSIVNVNNYINSVQCVKDYIQAGDCYQVNYSQRFTGSFKGSPWLAYRELRKSMPAPYGAFFKIGSGNLKEDSAILSYSPERFVKVTDRLVLTQPIKGTIARNNDPAKDQANAQALLTSEKNLAENLMIVDLLRNDLGKCCEYGSVTTEKLFELQSTPNVHHLVSSILGRLRTGQTPFDLLAATLPGGSVTGAPKIRAMEIIEELEPCRRSIYCGALGYINANGDMDSNVLIRSLLCHRGQIHCWGGGGIVADSEAEQEYNESLLKVRKLLDGLDQLQTSVAPGN